MGDGSLSGERCASGSDAYSPIGIPNKLGGMSTNKLRKKERMDREMMKRKREKEKHK